MNPLPIYIYTVQVGYTSIPRPREIIPEEFLLFAFLSATLYTIMYIYCTLRLVYTLECYIYIIYMRGI